MIIERGFSFENSFCSLPKPLNSMDFLFHFTFHRQRITNQRQFHPEQFPRPIIILVKRSTLANSQQGNRDKHLSDSNRKNLQGNTDQMFLSTLSRKTDPAAILTTVLSEQFMRRSCNRQEAPCASNASLSISPNRIPPCLLRPYKMETYLLLDKYLAQCLIIQYDHPLRESTRT